MFHYELQKNESPVKPSSPLCSSVLCKDDDSTLNLRLIEIYKVGNGDMNDKNSNYINYSYDVTDHSSR